MKRGDKILGAVALVVLFGLGLLALGLPGGAPREAALCGGGRHALSFVAGGSAPYMRLAADGASGLFLIDYGATASSLSAQAFSATAGSVRQAALSLEGVGAAAFALTSYSMSRGPPGGQLGIIGTDILSRLSVQFSRDAAFVGAAPCRPEALRARGLVAVGQRGFFGAEPTSNDSHNPNVPVVFINVGGVRAPAQIDTGYDDVLYSHSVDVNQPLFDRLVENGVALEHVADISVATCSGLDGRAVYRAPGRALAIETEAGAPVASIASFHLMLKRANGCGGIATMNAPAAQLGASFLKAFGSIVFDPKSAAVWIEKQN